MFEKEKLSEADCQKLSELSRLAKGDIITMTRLAGSGHPGGSISSLDMYLVLFSYARLTGEPRDRIVVSHGHTSPGVYSSLARLGHLPRDEVVTFFRKARSPFEGHVVKGIPFIDWSTGNLGQGLSAGCGFAIGSKIRGEDSHIYVFMGDGEQQKGQISEARRFAKKFGLLNITVIVDYNGLQISGAIDSVMPQNIAENYLSDGWDVLEIDGHNYDEVYRAFKRTRINENPTCIIAHTIMGKGIPFMENKEKYHGSPLNESEYREALRTLGLKDDFETYKVNRNGQCSWKIPMRDKEIAIDPGIPFTYSDEDKIDNRTAFGKALKDLAERNIPKGNIICVFDCDLASSVKTADFAKVFPEYFFQGGIQEHNTATIAGALSTDGILTFFADFGAFGIDETYNQQRLNDINKANLKLILTHVGLDVGQDGKTHQCVDYIGLANNLHNFKVIVPCDPNQMDRVTRYVAASKGNFLVAMGRSRWGVTVRSDRSAFYGDGYEYQYGTMDVLKEGKDGVIIAYGGMVHKALHVSEILEREDMYVGVVNMSSVKEVDGEVMKKLRGLPLVVTYEDHNVLTGIAPRIATYLLSHGYTGRMESLGVKAYGVSDDAEEAYAAEGLDAASVAKMLLGISR
ncbi:MAG: transketolase [Syntrophobacterales bacterium]|jgi:transketolase|nr:transketolase [Syntrophobacterales bacterium]